MEMVGRADLGAARVTVKITAVVTRAVQAATEAMAVAEDKEVAAPVVAVVPPMVCTVSIP